MANNKDLLSDFGIDPEDIPSGKEMAKYVKDTIGGKKGMVCYNKYTNRPCGIAQTEEGFKYFGPLVENFVFYHGALDEKYQPCGKGCLYNGKTLLAANFLDGCVNDSQALLITKKHTMQKCFIGGININ